MMDFNQAMFMFKYTGDRPATPDSVENLFRVFRDLAYILEKTYL